MNPRLYFMSGTLAVLCIGVLGLFVAIEIREQRENRSSSPCVFVQQVLSLSQQIKIGMKRSEVEKHFVSDGGLQFPDRWRYTHPRCAYIKLEIEFKPAPDRGPDLISKNDTVKSISKLYIEYPVTD